MPKKDDPYDSKKFGADKKNYTLNEKKVEVIKAHKSELERVRYQWLDFFCNLHKNDGPTAPIPSRSSPPTPPATQVPSRRSAR